jgi:hypothetical protein
MDQSLDVYLSRILKKWVAVPRPPEDGRSCLLREAAHARIRRAHKISLWKPVERRVPYIGFSSMDRSNTIFNWADMFLLESEWRSTI